ncbi:DNA starvation/stationary phase protection protein Dps [Deinococcus cellulosilyticus]|uniref:DNA starvation/stationary phase protection protein n=1 Tax=Deinococcus cellulosilyticus (strain DSM 18568 / NBRC 106333 / KACC 11606 / 5516J-15) TaxID=1223518 RepID=A0A511N8F7_DEIC1|nr:DNA starvation/stationary phase protection protein Dps [Deinococcus cellulosilyticus]GEM48766.1 DNA starvation/stationary phase protection protein [Deinococcus cellulosilyticus NBRC 106333 = KACC 11606]
MVKRMFNTRIDLDQDTRAAIIERLNQSLAELSDLYSQVKQAHWNIKGPDFIALHKFFDELASDLLPLIDEVAERIPTLGGYALGTVRMAASRSSLAEFPTHVTDAQGMVTALAEAYAHTARCMRESIDFAEGQGDKATADLFTEVTRELDTRLWFIEAHLQ